jgi:hypothetical protein
MCAPGCVRLAGVLGACKQRAHEGLPQLPQLPLPRLPIGLSPTAVFADDALPKGPHPAHRLDMLTGGLLICAKTRSAAASLTRQFEAR